MNAIYRCRTYFEKLYENYGTYLYAAGKFVTALLLCLLINTRLGSAAVLDSPLVVLAISLLAAFLPPNLIVIAAAVLVIAHLGALSLAAAAAGGGILLIVLLLYFSFAPEEAWAFLLTQLALAFHIPCVIPLAFGLRGRPQSCAVMALSTVSYYSVLAVWDALVGSGAVAQEEILDGITDLLHAVLKEQELFVMLIVLLAVFAIVAFVHRLAMRHAFTVAIGAGSLIYLVIMVAAGLMLDMRTGLFWILFGTLLSAGIALLLQFFFFRLDYRKTESLQFEDGEYYYYVQAVPKERPAARGRTAGRKGRGRDDGN